VRAAAILHRRAHPPKVSMARKRKFDVKKEIRKLARERVGIVPAARVIVPKPARKKPKHKKSVIDASGE
jgi:hypothetical protein